MSLAYSLPVSEEARSQIDSICGWLSDKKLVGRFDGFGNREYKPDKDLEKLILPLLDTFGLRV